VLSKHATERIDGRGITSDREVNAVVSSYAAEIRQHQSEFEVRVVVRSLRFKVSLPDGSNGDLVIACVDPRSLVVKTVMLQRRGQAQRKASQVHYCGLK
jgi:hypothetical protein